MFSWIIAEEKWELRLRNELDDKIRDWFLLVMKEKIIEKETSRRNQQKQNWYHVNCLDEYFSLLFIDDTLEVKILLFFY